MPESQKPYFFISYARHDAEIVHPIVAGLIKRGVNVWMDQQTLTAGQSWKAEIYQALRNAAGLIVFVSEASMASEWVATEISAAAASEQSFITPVILEPVSTLPRAIANRQWVDVSALTGPEQVSRAVDLLVRAVTVYQQTLPARPAPAMSEREMAALAEATAEDRRGGSAPAPPEEPPRSVFVVHGHDLALRDEVEAYLTTLGVEPVVLTKIANDQLSLLQKFLTWSRDVRFAVVLISADDFGASRRQYEAPDVGDRALQFRARQNVILELGFFYGYLGWEHVFVLFKPSERVFPNFERPSDLDGILFDEVDADGKWKDILKGRLKQAGFSC